MTKTNQSKALAVLAAAVLAACVLTLVAVQPAEAAYPGKNGKIAFQSLRDASGEIYTVSPIGGTANRITFPTGGNVQAAYSPDGSRIAFNKGGDIHVMVASGLESDGTGSRRLTSMGGDESEPTWSADGTRIAFLSDTSEWKGQTDPLTTDPEIWVMNADGSGQHPITENTSSERDPAWSPTGNMIAFVDERGDEPFNDTDSNVYVMDADGTDQRNITPSTTEDPPYQGHDEDPAWSPDGKKIAYVHGRTRTGGDAQDIWTMDPNGANKTNISDDSESTDNLIVEIEPAWSPLGDKIAYTLRETPNFDIAVMDADGTNEGAIDTGNETKKDEKPDWQPIPQCTITGTPGDDTGANALTGTDPSETATGNDVICGLGGNDTIDGKGGNDIILGQGGNDRITGGPGNDTINGGPGTGDMALYAGSTRVLANLTTEFAKGGAAAGMDVLLDIEDLSGSSVKDTLTGSPTTANVLKGLGGNDVLDVRDGTGNDEADGGTGPDDTCRKDAGDTVIRCE